MEALTDEAIAKQVQAGDREAFGELISRYEAKLTRYGRRFLGRPEAVTDCVQDVFIKAYTNLQSYDADQPFSPWIYRIAHNTFVNELKRYQNRFMWFTFETDTFFPGLTAKETADSDTLETELKLHLDTLIDALPQKYREVLLLHYSEDLSYQEISDILHIPINTIGVRLSRARQLLKAKYEAKYQTP